MTRHYHNKRGPDRTCLGCPKLDRRCKPCGRAVRYSPAADAYFHVTQPGMISVWDTIARETEVIGA
jgi:hypothetical protein